MKKKKHASGAEELVDQNASLKNKKCTKPQGNPKHRRKPHVGDHTGRNFVKRGHHPHKFQSQGFPEYDFGPVPFPHVYRAHVIPSYDHGAPAYPSHGFGSYFPLLDGGVPRLPYGVEVPGSPRHGVGPPDILPHSVTALGPQSHGIVAHSLASQGLGATSMYLKFPVVSLFGLPINCRETDIIRFFDGLDVVDVFLVFTAKKFSRKAFVVFSSSTVADFAIQRDKQMLGNVSVQILACSRQDYYDAVAVAVTGVDFSILRARAETPSDNNLLEHTHDVKSNAVADMNYLKSLQGKAMSLYDDSVVIQTHNLRVDAVAQSKVHERPEGEAKSLLIKDRAENGKIITDEANIIIDKDRPVLRVHGPPYFADMKVVIGVFSECDLSEDMIHIVLHPDGKPSGELFLEFMSQDDAKKAMSKDKTMIGSYILQIHPATMEDLRCKKTELYQTSDDKHPKGLGGHFYGSLKRSDDECKAYTNILKLRNVPPSADMHQIIEFFGEFNLGLDRLYVVCYPDGIATGDVYVRFDSVEDVQKAMSNSNCEKIFQSNFVQLFPSSSEEAIRAMT